MTAANPTMTVDGSTCSICLESFHNPVIIHCGHSFCRACITEYWKKFDINFCCPVCRICSPQKHLIPNRHLENILEHYKEFCLQSDAAYKNIGSMERSETKISWFHDFADMKKKLKFSQISPAVQHILRKFRGKISLNPAALPPATMYGDGLVASIANACGQNVEEVNY